MEHIQNLLHLPDHLGVILWCLMRDALRRNDVTTLHVGNWGEVGAVDPTDYGLAVKHKRATVSARTQKPCGTLAAENQGRVGLLCGSCQRIQSCCEVETRAESITREPSGSGVYWPPVTSSSIICFRFLGCFQWPKLRLFMQTSLQLPDISSNGGHWWSMHVKQN
jgi:hypothetical protein